MRRILLAGVAVVVTACGVQEMFTGDAGAVARTATAELRRDTLAAIMVGGKNVPLEREMVERWAFRWVEFSLFAERLAAGDSLLDSATVIAAMWPEANQWLVNAFHEQLANERVHVDSAVVDSAYAVGDHRLIQHILIRTTPDMSPPARTRRGLPGPAPGTALSRKLLRTLPNVRNRLEYKSLFWTCRRERLSVRRPATALGTLRGEHHGGAKEENVAVAHTPAESPMEGGQSAHVHLPAVP